jgi:hypothetical protein
MPLLERLAGHVREDGIELAVLRLPGVDQLDDVGVRERGADPGLAAESLDLAPRGGLRPLARAQQLERDRLAGGELSRLIDPPEAARPQLAEDLVAILENRSFRWPGGLQIHAASGPGAHSSPSGRTTTRVLRNARAVRADAATFEKLSVGEPAALPQCSKG